MADNMKTFKVGIGLDPQSAAPSNPKEGDMYIDDGSVNTEGLYRYDGADWILLGDNTITETSGSFNATFDTGAIVGANAVTTSVSYNRIGNSVTLHFGDARGTVNAASTNIQTSAADVPVALRPSTSRYISINVVNNGTTETPGRIVVNSTGTLIVSLSPASNWTNATSCGIFNGTVTYHIA